MAGLAQRWAAVVSQTTYLPMSGEELEQFLTRLAHRLVTAVAAAPVAEQAVIEVAAELGAHDLTGSSGIGRSIEGLSGGLPRLAQLQHVGGRDAAISRLLGALASGYAHALRQRTLDEQDEVPRALLQAKLDAERELRVSEARFRKIFSEAAAGIAISELDGTLVTANRAFAGIVGDTQEGLTGVALPDLLHTENDPALDNAYRMLVSAEVTHFRHEGHQLEAANGEVTWIILAGSLLHDPDGVPTHHIIITEDITELKLLQQRLFEQTLHDRLTGLPNEHYFMSRLKDVLEGAGPSASVTVFRVNLDNFAVINDGFSRQVGEQLLCSVARRLQDLVIGERAMVARMGADDFAILIENGMDSRDLSMFAATINIRLCEPVYINDRGIAVSAGVGVVRRRADETSAGELVRAADMTLHRAKRIGRGQWDRYDPEYDARQRERYQLAAEIPGAWENGEVDVYYQPVCRLDEGRIVALQAVLRWDRANGTVVGHSECLALAEQTGLVVSLGRWIVEQACRVHLDVVRRRQERQQSVPLMRVDLTAQLSQDPDLVGAVRGALSATDLPAEHLQVGVPLAALAGGRGDVVDNVGTVADLGTEVVLIGALAGPGYLTYLEDLSVRAVELAPEIVARIARRPGDDSVVARAARETIPLVHSTGATVIVPGVDTPEQAQWWRSVGADAACGAHFGPPVPGSALYTLLAPL